MRGLFPAGILARLEEAYGIRIADCFDLVVGTSTGGIIALGLGKGLKPSQIEEFYLDSGPRIFAGADSVLRNLSQNCFLTRLTNNVCFVSISPCRRTRLDWTAWTSNECCRRWNTVPGILAPRLRNCSSNIAHQLLNLPTN